MTDVPDQPRVLVVYYTYSRQALKVTEAIELELRARGCEVQRANIEFTDPRYAPRFAQFPLEHTFRDLLRMLPPQLRRATGEIRIPAEVEDGHYDLVCIGSPTWWLTTCMPIRSFLKSDTAAKLLVAPQPVAAFAVCRRYWRNNLKTVQRLSTEHGAESVGAIHFAFAGGQVKSLLSLFSYLTHGESRPKYHGVAIPPSNLQDGYENAARAFAAGLADRLLVPAR
jgi:menaquinone-dependent protoporphyrinogen IX oxidase